MEFKFDQFVLNTYDDIKPYLDDLVNREVKTKEETLQWFKDSDLLQSNIAENYHRRHVKHTCDTTNEDLKASYNFFITEISPKLQEVDDVLNKKIILLPGIDELEKSDEAFEVYMRGIRKALSMFREENIPLITAESEKEREYGEISGAMSVEYQGETLTIQQAAKHLESADREVRKEIFEKIYARRLQDKEKLDALLEELMKLRNTIAKNAGYESYVEYKRDAYDRFDYTQQDVFNFHEGVKEHIVPLLVDIMHRKKQNLGLDSLKPYDTSGTEKGKTPLHPFETGDELFEKATIAMGKIHPQFAVNLRRMKEVNHFDLSSRKGKAPGGYNCPMPVSKYPFIFMNAAGTHSDMITFFHEAGHAMHSVYSADIPPMFSGYPMELAEVASMSMELITMNQRDTFYANENDLKRAKIDQIEDRTLGVLAWISIIDSFQYRMYKNPGHTSAQRDAKFSELLSTYQPWVDRTGYEHVKANLRQKQLHIFEVPFYYIEYGIAQLGAYGVRKNYIENPQKAIEQYIAAFSLGYTKKLPHIYEVAGIPFDFSPKRMKELADFVGAEIEKIKSK